MSNELKKLEEKVKNFEIEYFCSEELKFEQLNKLFEELENYNENDIEKIFNRFDKKRNKVAEPYRTQTANINFILVEIMNMFIDSGVNKLDTEVLYQMDTLDIEDSYRQHLEKVKSLNINLKSFSNATINKKLNTNYFSDKKKKRDLIHKAVRYLTSYNIVKQNKNKHNLENIYELNFTSWTKFQRYNIDNTPILNDILVLLVAFIKFNAPNKVDDYLNHIDNIIKFLYTPPKDYPINSKIENYIIENNAENVFIDFDIFDYEVVKNTDNINNFDNAEILQISINEDNQKILKFKDTNTDKIYEVPLSKIYRLRSDTQEENFVYLKSEDCYVLYNDLYAKDIKNPNYPTFIKTQRVMLEVDTNLYEYFEVKPLNHQMIYKTETEKLIFGDEQNIPIDKNNSKFYVIATDTEDKILDVVKRNIPHINILSPTTLKDKLKDILVQYTK